MVEFDKGPPARLARLFAAPPDYAKHRPSFWYDWGPIFYRGRLNGTARVVCVASDPGPTERIVARSLVGDAGQRVQGFLTKLGLTRSYVCLNAFIYALHPSASAEGLQILHEPDHVAWRNRVFDAVAGPDLKAVVAFGEQAEVAVGLWTERGTIPTFNIPHPSSRDPKLLLDRWRTAVTELRKIVTPDSDGDAGSPNYGPTFREADYAPIPRRDLPFGTPAWVGDDSWGRGAHPAHNNCVRRPSPDDGHTLIWIAPTEPAG